MGTQVPRKMTIVANSHRNCAATVSAFDPENFTWKGGTAYHAFFLLHRPVFYVMCMWCLARRRLSLDRNRPTPWQLYTHRHIGYIAHWIWFLHQVRRERFGVDFLALRSCILARMLNGISLVHLWHNIPRQLIATLFMATILTQKQTVSQLLLDDSLPPSFHRR